MTRTAQYDPTRLQDIIEAATVLRNGGCVAFPTETVFGLGVDATNSIAVQRAFAAKGRPSDNPLIVHLHTPSQMDLYCHSISEVAYKLIDRFCPGPLTIVLPRRDSIATSVTAGLETVAIRFPKHEVAQALLREINLPIAAPSANLSGRPSATTWQAVIEDLDGRIDGVVCGEPCEIGIESTVVDVTRELPTVLRCGGVTLEQLREVIPEVAMHDQQIDSSVNSPGLRHRHYQPTAKVVLINSATEIDRATKTFDNDLRCGYLGIEKIPGAIASKLTHICYCDNEADYANSLFRFFRECDNLEVQLILCQGVDDTGLGRALMDRIRRASCV
ncbi:MAG: L-threonylcarbamoyladenylate synthase [Planctomycetota bacterium]|nr:L-threonylcarbamoyladenylate synthase [Planctomycetota bacterium]